jgi:hypothetical protein
MLKGTAIVLKISEPLLDKGYTLWMDYYNSPALAKFLKPLLSAASITEQETWYTIVKTVILLCASMGVFEAYHTRKIYHDNVNYMYIN